MLNWKSGLLAKRSSWAVACVSGAVAFLGGGSVFAQPDVTVGELDAIQHYTASGAIGGIRAYSVGTVSCNIGNQPLEWVDEPNEYPPLVHAGNIYPVISGNIYRLDSSLGRFRQVGQSWLKHGFCALNGTACDSCPQQSNPGCAYLMPQCSDPYSAGLNGSQGGLGPKYDINPATGFIPLNWSGQGTTGNNIFKRIQVAETELTAASSLFFVSSLYMHPQDATNNVDNNSQSYRRFTVNTGTFAASVTGSTIRQSPAIFAWRDHGGGVGVPDNTVQLSAVDVPSDGRFWIGSKVVQVSTSPARWRYEFAVQNLNSDRGASSFTVPIVGAATITAIGFSDVNYHSGELQTGTDWTGVASGSAVTWTYANNQGDDRFENILRWDTIYNFWFEADVAPSTGTSTIAMFKPGTPTIASGASYVVGGTGGAPFNDTCSGATIMSSNSGTFDTTNATTDGPLACLESGDNRINKDVWFRWTAPTVTCPGNTTFQTCGSAYDTKLAVYADGCTPADNSQLACNDDTAGCQGGAAANGLGSRVAFAATPGTTYLIRVGGFTNTSSVTTAGTGVLTIINPDCTPSNNACAGAIIVPAGTAVATGSTVFSTNDGTATCGTSATSPDVWYKYLPTISQSVTVSTCGSAYDTVLSIHSACGGTQLGCNDDHAAVPGCNENLSSSLDTPMTAGTTYFIRIAGYQGAVGNFVLNITGGGGGLPPANNDCANRAGFAGSVVYNTAFATTDGIAHACGQTSNDIWYNYPSTCTGTGTLTVTGSNYPARVTIYDDAGCTNYVARFLSCDNSSGGSLSRTFPVVTGRSYTIRVGGQGVNDRGTGTLTIGCVSSGCDGIDFNNDGVSPDSLDVADFLSVYGGGPCSNDPSCGDIDFNNDGVSPDSQDITDFLNVYGGGAC